MFDESVMIFKPFLDIIAFWTVQNRKRDMKDPNISATAEFSAENLRKREQILALPKDLA